MCYNFIGESGSGKSYYSDKTIVIDSIQYINMKDISLLKGEIIVMRDVLVDYTEEELEKYINKKKGMYE